MKNKNDSKPEIKIEKGVPIPMLNRGHKYPLRDMKIGDSIYISAKHDPNFKIRAAASYFSIRNPEYKFIGRTEDNGFRIWRVPCEPKL